MKRIFLFLVIFNVFCCPVQAKGVIQDGLWKTYDKNGIISSLESYRNLKRDGVVFEYYKQGDVKKFSWYHKDVPYGTARLYYESGKIKKVATYDNGELKSIENYDEQGKLTSKEVIIAEQDDIE
ncbi:MAG: hypothetical protein KAJ18_07935 [Candidatus Omnitrophica bacterium]|nr:hypothetical protein [Candidatus Omnitrophota bacterium]